MTGPEFSSASEFLREQLMDALDGVLISRPVRQPSPRSFERHQRLAAKLEDFMRAHLDTSFYSDALAKEVGTSVTTLKTAIREVHGVSLHQYLRNKRLWSLRAQLSIGLSGSTVSSAAVASGFSHMGELSHIYRAAFGESPSETLQRSKRA